MISILCVCFSLIFLNSFDSLKEKKKKYYIGKILEKISNIGLKCLPLVNDKFLQSILVFKVIGVSQTWPTVELITLNVVPFFIYK